MICIKRSFNTPVAHLQGLSNMSIRLTMKNGSTLDMEEFNIRGNTICSKNGCKALLNDVDYIELDSKFL